MAKIFKEEVDTLNTILKITIEKADYIKEYDKQLKTYQSQANLKGFRKGKTPIGHIRKMFGKQLIYDVINKSLQEQLNIALKDMDIFGDPIPNAESPIFDPNHISPIDHEFYFDLGIVPTFEVEGVNESDSYTFYTIAASDDIVDEDILNFRKRAGSSTLVEDDIQEGDLVKVVAQELDGEKVKEDGLETGFSIAIDDASDSLKKKLLKKKKGDTLNINVYKDVQKDATKEHVRSYILGIEKDNEEYGENFECNIIEVNRVELAELNQESFDKAFGEGKVKSEEEFREKIREAINNQMQGNADAIAFRNLKKALMEKNEMEVPSDFLKRWIKLTNEKNISDEQLDKEFPYFVEDLKWSVIRGKLIKKFELSVSEEELKNGFMSALMGYGLDPSTVPPGTFDNYIERMMEDQKAVREQADRIMGDKLFDAIKDKVTNIEEKLDEKEIEELVKKVNEEVEAENEKVKAAIQTEEVEVK